MTLSSSALLLAVVVSAGADADLKMAREAYERLAFDEAAVLLERARRSSVSLAERRAIFDLLARSLVAQGKLDGATDVFADLLREDPNAPEPADASPTIRKRYDDAKRGLFPGKWVRLEAEELPDGSLAVTILDPHALVAKVTRRSAQGDTQQAERVVSAPRGAKALFPPFAVPSTLTAHDAQGEALASVPFTPTERSPPLSASAPAAPVEALTPPPAEATKPVSRAGLAFASAGVVAVGAAAVLGILAAQDHQRAGDAAFASQTVGYDERAYAKALGANVSGAAGIAGLAVGAVLLFEL